MQSTSPYQAPSAKVDDPGPREYGQVKIWTAAGRLGRVRYIGYSIGMTLLFYAVIGVSAAMGAATKSPALGAIGAVIGVLGILLVTILLTIQRCHDFNMSGWLSLLLIVPLAPLAFWIARGSDGPNRFGNPPPPNSTGAVMLALILPLVFVVGILAAIAVPAYHDYVKRAQAAQDSR